jgi:hypothetical protein
MAELLKVTAVARLSNGGETIRITEIGSIETGFMFRIDKDFTATFQSINKMTLYIPATDKLTHLFQEATYSQLDKVLDILKTGNWNEILPEL